ncbi:MAG: signal peptidase I, partial [Nitrospinae bacterium]|nr:signal peptidase I [Nitrospinota bacterium]
QTLLVGDHMIVEKLSPRFGTVERGAVMVFANPFEPGGADLVKRVVGLPGETLAVVDGHAVIDGKPLDEPYVRLDPAEPTRRDFGPVTFPPDAYFMMGDNRDHSFDSRGWGFLPRAALIGRALFIHWSWKDGGWSVRWDRLGTTLG